MSGRVITIVGGGLAGSEAAWQAARHGVSVHLHEMRPVRRTPAHQTAGLAELVCSNSLKSVELSNAHGLLKEEMRRLGSLIIDCATRTRLPAGAALAVDRVRFSEEVSRAIESHPRITVVRDEVTGIPEEGIVVIAAGPLVSDSLGAAIARFTGRDHLYFFDAIAPVVEADSIDRSIAFAASRYGKGGGSDYLNCPLTRVEYEAFIAALVAAEKAPLHEFDRTPFFEGCLPIEEMARRGPDTLRFGPMKPVGLADPRSGRRPHAVVQLRQDDLAAEHYSMVGFQTQLRWPEQKRIFNSIPGLEHAEFVRLGQLHRNCYIDAPQVLGPDLAARTRDDLFFAGQISGVEGYTESAATGLIAGTNAARLALGSGPLTLPRETMLGALCHYISHSPGGAYQPTNAAFGLLPEPDGSPRGKMERKQARATRALLAIDAWIAEHHFAAAVGEGR